MAKPLDISGFNHIYSGKVRDLYENQNNELLVVASDRISAFDWVLPTEIPDKGKILTALSLWWFEQLSDVVENHIISTIVPEVVKGRAILVHKLKMLPIEAVVRGYLTGSGLGQYQETAEIRGIKLPSGLVEASKLENPIFTPATKAEIGEHDENISFKECQEIIGSVVAEELRAKSIKIYKRASEIALKQGIIIADTKFEFGRHEDSNDLILGDEVLTPDSSRFWPATNWQPGQVQNSFDKQFVRNWLNSADANWDKETNTSPPALPEEIVEKTRARYIEAYEIITGEKF